MIKICHNTIVLIGMLVMTTSFRAIPQENVFTLTVKVEGLRNSKGMVQFALYNQEGSIPDEKLQHYYRIAVSEINEGSTSFSFPDLPKGLYAVNVLHDENENGKIDKGLVFPKEGIGFSNYGKIGLSNRPKFLKASFELDKDCTKLVKILYL